ncbi:MAG: FHA domain-containing protein [Myxococcaceae bacterium]
MAPPHPKNPNRPRPAAADAPRRRPATVELPSPGRRQPVEEAIPTTIYSVSHDEELPPTWDAEQISEPGYRPAYLYVEKGPGQGQLLPVRQGALVIGRASVSELRLQHPSVSRRHAQLTRLGERFYLKDLGSQNGTIVNKIRIETEIEVYPGDFITIGTAQLKLRGASDRISPETQQQIRKVQTAKRKAVAAPPSPPQKSARTNVVAVAAACTAIGFGLAALAFAALEYTQDASPRVTAVSHPEEVVASEPAVDAKTEIPTPAREEAAKPEPKKVVAASPRAETKSAPDHTAIIARYADGDVSGAITLAKAGGAPELVEKLTAFQSAHVQAEEAVKAGNGKLAIGGYERALAVDAELSGGWGKQGPVLSKKLGDLYTQAGQSLRTSDPEGALNAFQKALKYTPNNETAKSELAMLEEADPGSAEDDVAEDAVTEDAVEEDQVEVAPRPRPTPTPRPAKRKAAIADTWDDGEAAEDTEDVAAGAKPKKDARIDAIEDAWND